MAIDFKLPRIGALGIVGLLGATAFFVAAVVALFGGHPGNANSVAPSEQACIRSGSKSTPLATTQDNYDEAQKALLARDWVSLRQMVGQDRVFVIDEGTRVRVVETNWDWSMAQVEVLDGPQTGKIGWIAAAYLAKSESP